MKVVTGQDVIRTECAEILYDESRFSSGVPARVYYPETLDDVREAVREAHATQTPITVIGAQTGITGGAVPIECCIALCLSCMRRILRAEIREGMAFLYCQPGVTLENIETFLKHPSLARTVEGAGKLADGEWFYPVDPTEMTAQIGGTVATNASGARSFRFGPTRNHVESLQVVLAGGDTVGLKRGDIRFDGSACEFVTDQGNRYSIPAMKYEAVKVKNAAGYYNAKGMDLIDLFIGCEGTLGIFTEVGIKLMPKSALVAGLSFMESREGAFAFADFLRKDTCVMAIEYFDTGALHFIRTHKDEISLKLPDLPQEARAAVYWEFCERNEGEFEERMEPWEHTLNTLGSSFDLTWSGFDEQEMLRLKTFRHAVPERVNLRIAQLQRSIPSIRKVGTDAAVPEEYFESFFKTSLQLIEIADIETIVFGHIGDCHLHFNMIPSSERQMKDALDIYRRIMQEAVRVGGTVSAEHGIGKLKREYLGLMYGKEAIEEMKRVKRALDPEWLLNSGNLFEGQGSRAGQQ